MKTKPTNNQKTFQHLSLSERIIIEQSLNDNISIRQIALQLDKSASSISREIKKRRCYKGRRSPKTYPRCTKYAECTKQGLCHDIRCYKYQCRLCAECKKVCPEYDPGICPRLDQAPYVCNGCDKLRVCTYERLIYVAQYADDVYHNILSGCREGINQTPEKLQEIDLLISPLIKQGQSITHIYATHG